MFGLPRVSFTNDLNEIPHDIKANLETFWELLIDPKQAPPLTRNYRTGLAPLDHINEDGTREEKGTFSIDLYDIALKGELQCQIQDTAERYLTDQEGAFIVDNQGMRILKTPFQLAVLPFIYSDDDKTSHHPIIEAIEKEMNYQIERGHVLSRIVYKYCIPSDYLAHIANAGLTVLGARDVVINLLNPADKTTKTERWMHWLAQRAAFILAVIPVIAIAQLYSPLFAIVFFTGTMIANWCAKEFGTFDLAEWLLRDANWLMHFSWEGENLSLKKSIKTAVFFAAMILPVCGAAALGWSSIVLLPWPAFASTGIAGAVLKFSLATSIAFIEATGTFAALGGSLRFFYGLGPRNTQITFNERVYLPTCHPKDHSFEGENESVHLKELERIAKLPEEMQNQAFNNESLRYEGGNQLLQQYRSRLTPAANDQRLPIVDDAPSTDGINYRH